MLIMFYSYTIKTAVPILKEDSAAELEVHLFTGPFSLQPPAHAHTLVSVNFWKFRTHQKVS